jgi:Xaa-Pro aminopeptidase
MFEALSVIPRAELESRWAKVRRFLAETAPEAEGLLAFSRINIYYLGGTLGTGCFWLPREGEPLFFSRKGAHRAALESPTLRVVSYKSYKDLEGLARDAGCPIPSAPAAEVTALSWQLGQMLTERLPGRRFLPGDLALNLAQSLKSEYELSILRLAGERHHQALHDILPQVLKPGMNEREISHLCWQVFFTLGHQGLMRMSAFGEEIFLGHVSAGDSGNYPSAYNGPLGVRGEHPASPYMGYAGKVWGPGQPLGLDIGFVLEGYHTDKTQQFWSGTEESIPDQVRSAHSFCMDVQAWAAENLRPGSVPSRLWAHCWDWAVKAGFGDGFMGLGQNKVPFLGHGIGLAIDGYPAIARGFDRPLEEGMVLALEPKQGIPGVGMVGVENTFEVTASGGRCITGDDYRMLCIP